MRQYSDFFYHSDDHLRLHARLYSGLEPSALPIVYLPAAISTARSMHVLATAFAAARLRTRPLIAFDYRGRGLSDYDDDWRNYTVEREAADVAIGLAALGVKQAHFIGESRGGLLCHVLAETNPELIASTVLNDVGPEIDRKGLAGLLDRLPDNAEPASLAEAILRQKTTHGRALAHLPDASWKAVVLTEYRLEGEQVVADYDPALINQITQVDPGIAFPHRWPQFALLCKKPVLVIRGEQSTLLTRASAEKMRSHDNVTLITLEDQVHAPPLQCAQLPTLMAAFFDAADAGAAQPAHSSCQWH